MSATTSFSVKIKNLFRVLGPGLITGASDDDPSGIATYSQAGAQFGLAIPVLAGSLSYILAETFGWEAGLDKKFYQAKGFYITGIISILIGLALNFAGVSPMQSLIYTAILYGLTSPVMIAVILHISNNKKIMGKFTNRSHFNILGFITLALMTEAAIALIYFQF
ncbi:MAG TPA: divalent metal cation transporter [Saprospiraceae bacterium]|nr:divalent metal cation transporter [Saprospiraceae bacterium]HPI04810.1 divalent metal cation transporter [Saprospiraceae bacterium]